MWALRLVRVLRFAGPRDRFDVYGLCVLGFRGLGIGPCVVRLRVVEGLLGL